MQRMEEPRVQVRFGPRPKAPASRRTAACRARGSRRPSSARLPPMNKLDPTRAALLALDFQNYGVHPQGYWAKHGEPDWPAIARPAVDNTARVLAAARRHRLLVIHVGSVAAGQPRDEHDSPLFARGPDRSVEGTWGSEFYAPVAPAPGELVVYRRAVSALAGTEPYADELARLEPPGAFEQRQADRRSMLAAIHAGLLRRALLLARTR